MPVAWRPRIARVKADAAPGAGSIKLRPSALDGVGSFMARIGTQLVTISGQAGDTWVVSGLGEGAKAGALATEVTIRVVVNGLDHTGVATKLRHSERSPEGEIEATWEISTRTPGAYTPNLDGNPIPFQLLSNELGGWVPFFAGYMGRVTDEQLYNGFHALKLTGRGGYVTLDWNGYGTSKIWPAETAGHRVIEDAIGAWDPYISPSTQHIIDGALQIGQELEGFGQSPRALINHVMGRGGDPSGSVLEWYVRTDTDGIMKLWVILRSRNPTISVPIHRLRAPGFAKDYELRRTRIVIKWQRGYIDETAIGATGAVRWRSFDYSSQIDNEELARQVAKTYLQYWSTIEALSDGQVELVDPDPVSGIAPHRIKAGWYLNVTGWTGGFSIGTFQIKGLEADHEDYKLGMSLGRVIEDDLNYAEQFNGRQTKLLGSPMSGLLPLNIAPPPGMATQVSSPAIGVGTTGKLGWQAIADDADVIAPVYMIQAGYDSSADPPEPLIITPGRKQDFQVGVGGQVTGFKMIGNDGVLATPGPGTISIKVGQGTFATAPAFGTERTTLEIADDTTGSKNLDPPTATPALNQKFTVAPGDRLTWEVLGPESDPDTGPEPTLNNISILILIQRTSGSARSTSTGAPDIIAQTHTREPITGYSVFTVQTDRPAHIQIEYGKDTSYKSHSQPSPILGKTVVLKEPAIGSPFHWRVIAKDDDGHVTNGEDQSG